ncbi:MAG: long-chain-fatty-acid--CoA ligase [Candidatus Eremiobacteraeota bacterium]|nr:long-chain-fatty-acid--CoA ligase [Candidatus Eremiobacteraeota bacterium]
MATSAPPLSPPAVHLRPLTPLDFLERSAYVFPEKAAVVDGDVRRTYPELRDRVYRLATVLQAMGVRDGERVAVLAPNASAILEAHFAVPLAGGILCALNIRLTVGEIDYILEHCGASVLIYDADFDEFVKELKPRARCIRVGAPGEEYEKLLAAADPTKLHKAEPDEDATLSINYTSGTTGRPKGVMYTYRGAFVNALAEIFHAGMRPESVYLWTLPMFHCNGWIFPYAVTAAGATHVCLRKVDPKKIFELIETEKVTHLCGAPTVWISLANDPSARPFPHRIHITTAGAPPSPTIIKQMEALGAEMTHVYGLTETYGPITVCQWKSPQWDGSSDGERARLKSRQGVAMLTMDARDVRVVDSNLNDVPADGKTHGEIVMRGNNVMKGYYADPEATAKAFAGGWFHSGDVAVMQSDGYIEIVDRAKDVIISGGENISTIQVEKVLVSHEAVLECAVVAMPDPKWGEVPKAYVTLKPGRELTAEALIAFAREHLPGFKTPKAIEFGPLPKTSTGKIQKFILREREWAGREKRVN